MTRITALTAAALSTWYSGLYVLETYCGVQGQAQLNNITQHKGDYTGADVAEYCYFGGATFLLREMSIGLVKTVGLLVIQPLANEAFNKVFDYFYGPGEEHQDDVPLDERIVEITDSEEDSNDHT